MVFDITVIHSFHCEIRANCLTDTSFCGPAEVPEAERYYCKS